jgi:hypothetical protein
MLGSDMVVARPKTTAANMHIVRGQRASTGRADFGTAGGSWMPWKLAGSVAASLAITRRRREVIDESGAARAYATRLVDDEKFRGGRTLDGSIGGDHRATSTAGSARAIASISSAAATSGLLSDAGSASGIAIA